MTGFTQVAGIEIFVAPALAADIRIGSGVAALAVRRETGVIHVCRYPACDHMTGIAGLICRYVRRRVLALRGKLAGTVVTRSARHRCLRVVKPKRWFPASREFVVAQLALVGRRQTDVVFARDAAGLQSVMTGSAVGDQRGVIDCRAEPCRDFMANTAFFRSHNVQRSFTFRGELAGTVVATRTQRRGFGMVEGFYRLPCAGRHVMALLAGVAGVEPA